MGARKKLFIRLWAKIDVKGEDECWNWIGAKNKQGYGSIGIGDSKRVGSAHKLVYIFFYGDPGDMLVLHTCDNPSCCNPRHLKIGTHTDNASDKIEHGRAAYQKGEHAPNVKLSEKAVKEIKRLISEGVSQKEIARRYNIWSGTVRQIERGQTWSHVKIQ